jgi:hypothetical protein
MHGQPMLIAESTDEPSLSRDDVFTIQTTLNELGFDAVNGLFFLHLLYWIWYCFDNYFTYFVPVLL